jgi:hypothetical protein
MAILEDFFPKKSFAPFILYIFGHHGVKFCPITKKHWFQLLEARKKEEEEEGKVARLLYFASIANPKYKMMIKNSCLIFGLWPDLAKYL